MSRRGEWIERESRSAKRLEVLVRREDGEDFPAVITNISKGGCRLKSDQVLTAGEAIYVEVPRLGGFYADVRWSDGCDAGAILGVRSGPTHSTTV